MLEFNNTSLYKVYVGLNDQKEKVQLIDTNDALVMTSLYLANHFEGATVYNGIGVYKHEDGTIVRENSLIIELVYVTDTMVETLIKHLQTVFNQESIMIVKSDIGVQFYG